MDGVDSAVSRVQDTKEVVVVEGAPPENVSVRVTAVSQCGQRSDPASETTSVATISAGRRKPQKMMNVGLRLTALYS